MKSGQWTSCTTNWRTAGAFGCSSHDESTGHRGGLLAALGADDTVDTAENLLARQTTQVIRCDNGPKNVSAEIQRWAEQWGIRIEYIQSGKPQQNAYVERFNRTVRYEWLSQYHRTDLEEVQLYATQWMWKYNHDRPNKALGGITPKQRLAMAT